MQYRASRQEGVAEKIAECRFFLTRMSWKVIGGDLRQTHFSPGYVISLSRTPRTARLSQPARNPGHPSGPPAIP
jgi:hypothetical protein